MNSALHRAPDFAVKLSAGSALAIGRREDSFGHGIGAHALSQASENGIVNGIMEPAAR